MVRHHWFIRLRWIIAFATVVLLLVERYQTPGFHRPVAVGWCIGVLAVANVVWTILSRGLITGTHDEADVPRAVIRRVVIFANAQMAVDLLILTAILRYSGGIENPMAVFYLFHVLIAALLLTPLNALFQGCWALLLYGGLGVAECVGVIRPHYSFLASTANSTLHTDWGFVVAGISVLAAGVFGALFFTRQISKRLDEQEGELHKANAALRRRQVEIRDLQARRSRFMQTAAHQLKSPLTGIETLAGLIRARVVSPVESDDIAARVIARCGQAISQVTELLTLARVQEAAPARHHTASAEVGKIIRRITEAFADQARSRNIDLQVRSAGPEGVSASVDERDLEDGLMNLVDNAVKYTADGGSVWVKATSGPDSVSISVKDTGTGIAEDSVDDLFAPFRRGNLALAADVPGSGLGLAIVLEVVEQANGRVEVRSTVGKGSEFILTFPRCDAAAPAPAARGTRSATPTNQGSSPR
jgi:signal transduction histidine kinase